MIHGLSVIEVESRGGKWGYRRDSAFNRRVTTMSDAVIHGPARGSAHLVTKFSQDGTRARGKRFCIALLVSGFVQADLHEFMRFQRLVDRVEHCVAHPAVPDLYDGPQHVGPTAQRVPLGPAEDGWNGAVGAPLVRGVCRL